MSLSVKAFLRRRDGSSEIHRLAIDQNVASSYTYLCQKLCQVYPVLKPGSFTICWKDEEDDEIVVSSDEELIVALGSMKDGILKIYINRKSKQNFGFTQQAPNPEAMENDGEPQYPPQGNTHPCVTCDGCNQAVSGYRYKCLECPDFDLCAKCETAGVHAHHFILRISSPSDNPGFIPPFLGPFLRNPGHHPWGPGFCKQFMKNMDRASGAGFRGARRRFNYGFPQQGGAGFGFNSTAYASAGCPFSAHNPAWTPSQQANNEPQPGAPHGPEPQPTTGASTGPAPACDTQQTGNPLPFLNPQMFQRIWTTLGGLPTESGQRTDGATQQENNTGNKNGGEDFLKCVGESVAAFFDPLGIDVQVDVEHNGKTTRCGSQETNQQSGTQAQTEQKAAEPMETDTTGQHQATQTSVPTQSQGTVTTDSLRTSMQNIHIDMSAQQQINTIPEKREISPESDTGDWAYVEHKDQSSSQMDNDDLVIVDIPQPVVDIPQPVMDIPQPVVIVPSPVSVPQIPASIPTQTTTEPPKQDTTAPRSEREARMAEALTHLLDMGFSNEGGWLTYLLDVKDGDIHQVLDSLQPGKYNL